MTRPRIDSWHSELEIHGGPEVKNTVTLDETHYKDRQNGNILENNNQTENATFQETQEIIKDSFWPLVALCINIFLRESPLCLCCAHACWWHTFLLLVSHFSVAAVCKVAQETCRAPSVCSLRDEVFSVAFLSVLVMCFVQRRLTLRLNGFSPSGGDNTGLKAGCCCIRDADIAQLSPPWPGHWK